MCVQFIFSKVVKPAQQCNQFFLPYCAGTWIFIYKNQIVILTSLHTQKSI